MVHRRPRRVVHIRTDVAEDCVVAQGRGQGLLDNLPEHIVHVDGLAADPGGDFAEQIAVHRLVDGEAPIGDVRGRAYQGHLVHPMIGRRAEPVETGEGRTSGRTPRRPDRRGCQVPDALA